MKQPLHYKYLGTKSPYMLIVAPSNNTFAIEAVVVTISLHCLIGGGEAILVIAESLGLLSISFFIFYFE